MIAVIFEADVVPTQQTGYLELAAELKPLLADIEGFISIERFQNLTTEGKATIFSFYRISVAQTLRNYTSAAQGARHV